MKNMAATETALIAAWKKCRGGEEQPVEFAARVPGSLEAVVGPADVEIQKRKAGRTFEQSSAQDVCQVLFHPEMKDIPHVPEHFSGEQQDQAECNQPGQDIVKPGRAAAGRIDHGVDQMPGHVDEQGRLDSKQNVYENQPECGLPGVGTDVTPGPAQVGENRACVLAAVPVFEVRSWRHLRLPAGVRLSRKSIRRQARQR